ncbi:MAG: aspartate-semialdehyde dehydrogenase, partial [Candidatus Hydrothermarchaeales archaeon]
ILGATGLVGQRFIQLLSDHPYFELTDLTASSKSAGKPYAKVGKWYLDEPMPEDVAAMEVKATDPNGLDAEIAFSALPSDIAKEAEVKFAEAGFIVASNASAYRMEDDIPLLIPEVNPNHLGLLDVQREKRGWDGSIITNPNCTTIIAFLSLKPIFDEFGIESAFIASMQAVSGAGYEGVVSMAIIDNVIPFISGEEEKLEEEGLKIFGKFDGNVVIPAEFKVSAACNRVPVLDGHTESIFLKTRDECDIQELKKVMAEFKALPQELKLPTAPENPIIIMEEEYRPQPRFDRMRQKGMAVSVGRLRKDPIFDLKYTVMGHNTIRGAAGASVLNAELLLKTRDI